MLYTGYVVADELEIDHEPVGSTTWRRKDIERALESDLCYCFEAAKLAANAAARERNNLALYPNPHLAVHTA